MAVNVTAPGGKPLAPPPRGRQRSRRDKPEAKATASTTEVGDEEGEATSSSRSRRSKKKDSSEGAIAEPPFHDVILCEVKEAIVKERQIDLYSKNTVDVAVRSCRIKLGQGRYAGLAVADGTIAEGSYACDADGLITFKWDKSLAFENGEWQPSDTERLIPSLSLIDGKFILVFGSKIPQLSLTSTLSLLRGCWTCRHRGNSGEALGNGQARSERVSREARIPDAPSDPDKATAKEEERCRSSSWRRDRQVSGVLLDERLMRVKSGISAYAVLIVKFCCAEWGEISLTIVRTFRTPPTTGQIETSTDEHCGHPMILPKVASRMPDNFGLSCCRGPPLHGAHSSSLIICTSLCGCFRAKRRTREKPAFRIDDTMSSLSIGAKSER